MINLEIEKNTWKNNLDSQILTKKTLLKYIDNISSNALDTFHSISGEIAYKYLIQVRDTLNKVDENIKFINVILRKYSSNSELNIESLNKIYDEDYYNHQKTISTNTLEIQKVINTLSEYVRFEFTDIQQEDSITLSSSNKNNKEEVSTDININSSNLKDNTLLISDIKQKVVLPYKISDLEKIYIDNIGKYTNLEEIVDFKYTIPLSYYKNTAVSRFKEAYSLVRQKSNGSIKSALDLGIEVFFKYDLNPAIITACRNIDELDIYLACLEDNDTNNFKCFDIVYEILPTVKKTKNKESF